MLILLKKNLNYFNNFKDRTDDLETAPLIVENTKESPETKAIAILKNVFEKLKKYAKNDEGHIINELTSNLDIMEKFILNNRKIYIPFIGVSSAGKTTTINCIVGYKLFPEALNECTTRGIIIEYSDVVELYEMKIDSNRNYYVFNEKNRVAEGYKEVREYLESLNARYGRNESKFFYKVKTTIKSFDDFGLDDELKKRILLIDLPGPDTKDNKFNKLYKNSRTPYEKLLLISSSFIYVNKGRAIKSTENKEILKTLYNNIQDNSSLSGIDYLKACLFVVNAFNNLNENEQDLNSINEDLSGILYNTDEPMFEISKKEIKSSILNAKNFYDYLKESTLLKDNDALLKKYLDEYLHQDEGSIIFKKDSFPKYCLQKLKLKLKDLGFNNINSKEQCSEEFLNKIKDIFSEHMTTLKKELKGMDNKIINEIANILFYFENDDFIKQNMIPYKNSFSEEFLENLKKQIIFSKIYKDRDYIDKLKGILKYFDTFFESNIKKPISINAEKFKEKRKEFEAGLEKICKDFNVNNFFNEVKLSIRNEVKKHKNLVKHYLNENKEDDEILDMVKESMKVHFDLLEEKVNNKINVFNEEIGKFINKIKEITSSFNQTNDLKNNEKYINNLNDLLLLNHHFILNNEEQNSNFIQKIVSFFYTVKYYFKKKNDINVIKEKIDNLKNKLINNLNSKIRLFNVKQDEQNKKIKANFKSILSLSFSDLSNIEEKEWEECKKLYYEAKGFLLSNENIEEIEEDKIEKEEIKKEQLEIKEEQKKEENKEEKKEEAKNDEKKEEKKIEEKL